MDIEIETAPRQKTIAVVNAQHSESIPTSIACGAFGARIGKASFPLEEVHVMSYKDIFEGVSGGIYDYGVVPIIDGNKNLHLETANLWLKETKNFPTTHIIAECQTTAWAETTSWTFHLISKKSSPVHESRFPAKAALIVTFVDKRFGVSDVCNLIRLNGMRSGAVKAIRDSNDPNPAFYFELFTDSRPIICLNAALCNISLQSPILGIFKQYVP